MLSIFLALVGVLALVVAGWLIHASLGLLVLGLVCLHGARATYSDPAPAPEEPR